MISPDTIEAVKTIALIAGQVVTWGMFAGWRVMRWVSNWPADRKAKLAAWSPKWWNRLDFLAGLFPNDKQMKRSLKRGAEITHSTTLEDLVDSYPDDQLEDEVTLTPPPPIKAVDLSKTGAPPPPTPEVIYRRPRVEGRHATSGEALPPEATETIEK